MAYTPKTRDKKPGEKRDGPSRKDASRPPSALTLESGFSPAGDQIVAIDALAEGLNKGEKDQVLLGVTGSGKTFTIANVIAKTGRPTLIMAPNKTLAAQLYGEMKVFFPRNAVEYFVSYYDYYQPEAYVAKTDTFIQKDARINAQIDRMRHSATRALLERRDVVVVASVSCIYGIGDVDSYGKMIISIMVGGNKSLTALAEELVALRYARNQKNFERGTFKIFGEVLDIFPSHRDDRAWRIGFFNDEVENIVEFDPVTGHITEHLTEIRIYANNHYVVQKPTVMQAIARIKKELTERLQVLTQQNKTFEAHRLSLRVSMDIEMLEATGHCNGIENYSRYLTGRKPGLAPPTLFEYLPDDAVLIMDESHVGVSQVAAMYAGDFNRKSTLVDHGFRLPSCLDNRPLKQEEWDALRPQTIFVSATPGPWELRRTKNKVIEQVVRPTGLLDPTCHIRPVQNQVDDLIAECRKTCANNDRVLITTLTKRMAENLTDYLQDAGFKVKYLHSDVDTLERIEIIRDLRLGVFDILVGINLLREGLDIPECALVAILDADKEGFLRSKTSLIQTIGRAARNIRGRVILYADTLTQSIKYAVKETERRRKKQQTYNDTHQIIPRGIKKDITDILSHIAPVDETAGKKPVQLSPSPAISPHMSVRKYRRILKKKMVEAAKNLDFETAASLRDTLRHLENCQEDVPIKGDLDAK